MVLLLGGAGGGLLSNVSAACDDSLAAALISEDPNDGLEGHVAVVVSRSSKLECRLGASLDCFLEGRQNMIAILRDHDLQEAHAGQGLGDASENAMHCSAHEEDATV